MISKIKKSELHKAIVHILNDNVPRTVVQIREELKGKGINLPSEQIRDMLYNMSNIKRFFKTRGCVEK